MNNTVKFVQRKTFLYPYEVRDHYSLNQRMGWVWLQKLCFYILKKIGCVHIDYEQKIETITIDKGKFIERLLNQQAHLLKEFNRKPTKLYIGLDDYRDLMEETFRDNQMFSFDVEYYTKENRRIYPDINGLKVEVIPWMKGFIVI